MIIGRKAKNIKKADALKHVAGYCTVNDLSEREFQVERSGQWTKGKSYDTFGPVGPWLVTEDEVKDPQNLHLWLELNGKRVQDGSTATMVYGVPFSWPISPSSSRCCRATSSPPARRPALAWA